MGKFKNQNGEVILNLDNYIIGQANLTYETSFFAAASLYVL